MNATMPNPPETRLQELYPDFSQEELLQAEETLDRYILALYDTFLELQADQERYAHFVRLTENDGTVSYCTLLDSPSD